MLWWSGEEKKISSVAGGPSKMPDCDQQIELRIRRWGKIDIPHRPLNETGLDRGRLQIHHDLQRQEQIGSLFSPETYSHGRIDERMTSTSAFPLVVCICTGPHQDIRR
jgi:hypothetical protein